MRALTLGVIVGLVTLLSALPLAGSAAAPNLGRVSATGYEDTTGAESIPLCSQTGIIDITISFSGVGPDLEGNGTGDAFLSLSGGGFFIQGQIEMGDQVLNFDGGAGLTCFGSSLGFAQGGFQIYISDAGSEVAHTYANGTISGSLSDGVHPNQGRVSLTLVVQFLTDDPI